ncbi:MAG: PQQ-binding-like beta-propeller repeat protein [Bryobacterales bacterium]|nr:PQQ-binding-like beta-propeller repeat protein [Bryobacterales bacterium]
MSRMLFSMLVAIAFGVGAADWPSYRGPGANGVGDGSPPVAWNADASAGEVRNVLWKMAIPGLSHSSPIVWGSRLYVTTAVSAKGNAPLKIGLYGAGDSADDVGEQSWVVYCLDKRTGKEVWKQTAHRGAPKVKRHTKATHDNTTLATDGKRLVTFLGSEGLYAYSMDGKLLWKKDLGVMDMTPFDDRTLSWGFASSPTLFEDTVLVQNDSKKDSFAAAFDAKDGRELWRVPRGEVSVGSWGSPGVIRAAGRTQVVLNGYPWIVSYDFKTGKELWRMRSGGDVPVPTPFLADGLIYVANAHGRKAPLYAIRPDASGDISLAEGATTSSGVVWAQERNGSYLQTPVVYEGIAYASTSQGIFKAYDAKTGEKYYERRLGEGTTGFTSSPVAAGGHVYVTSEEGETYVVKHGRTFEQAAKNAMGETVLSTPAISEGVLYFHTRGHVVAVGR